MKLKTPLLIALVTVSLISGVTQAAAGKHENNFIYQVTGVKGKALVQLPNGQQQIIRPGMKIRHGSRISVLENSILNGYDIQNRCEVEYRECVNRPLHRNHLCAALTTADVQPQIVEPTVQSVIRPITRPVVAAAAFSPTPAALVPAQINYTPYLVGGGLLAALALSDAKDITINNNNSDSNDNNNNGGNNDNDNNNSGGNNDNDGGNNSGGNNDNDGGNNTGGNNDNDNNNSGGNNDNGGGNNTGGNNDNDGGNNAGGNDNDGGNNAGGNDNDGGNNSGGNDNDGGNNSGGNDSDGGNNSGGNDSDGGNNSGGNDSDNDKDDGKIDDEKPVSH